LVVSSLSSVADGCSSGNLVLLVQIYKNIMPGKVEITNQDLYKVLHRREPGRVTASSDPVSAQ